MQDDLSVTNTPTSDPTSPEVQPIVLSNDQHSKVNSFLTILLSVLLFLSLSIAGFFAYQTQKLAKELTFLKTDPILTSDTTSKLVATSDPTADWKTYTNTKIGASVKYPQGWILKEETNGVSVDFNTLTLSPKTVDQNQVNYYFNFQLEDPINFQAWSNDISSKKLSPININGLTFDRIISADMFYSLNYIYKTPDGKIYRFYLGPYTEIEKDTVLDSTINQILSTFKFTN